MGLLRIASLDESAENLRIESLLKSIGDWRNSLLEEPHVRRVIKLSRLSSDLRSVGIRCYSAGRPLEEVLDCFSNSLEHYRNLLQIRAQDAAQSMSVSPERVANSAELIDRFPLQPDGSPDFSLGNSESTFQYACLCLAVGRVDYFHEFLEKMWDPPNAPYIGWNINCNPVARLRAHAFRSLIYGDFEKSRDLAKKVFPKRKWDKVTKCEADLLIELAGSDKSVFLAKLDELLVTVDWLSGMTENRFDEDYYVTFPGMAMAALAEQRGLISLQDLPDNPILPADLVR